MCWVAASVGRLRRQPRFMRSVAGKIETASHGTMIPAGTTHSRAEHDVTVAAARYAPGATATYNSVSASMTDLDAIERLHKDQTIGKYDAAVIDKENGKPRIAKRMDRPGVRVVPEWLGAAAAQGAA